MNGANTNRPQRNLDFYLDFAALLTMLGAIATGVILWLVLGHGPGQANKYLWGLYRQDWLNLHLSLTLALSAIMALHLARHWRWITSLTPRHLGLAGDRKGLAVFLATTALVGLVVWGGFVALNRNTPADDRGQGWRGGRDGSVAQQHLGGGDDQITSSTQSHQPRGMGYGRGQGWGQGWRGGRGGGDSL